MTYNVTQWYLDETGHWTKYAARRVDGGRYSMCRDTRTAEPMQFANAIVGFGIPTVDAAFNAIARFNLIRGFLPNADTRAVVDANARNCGGFNTANATGFINSTPAHGTPRTPADETGAAFLRGLLEFPRFVLPTGAVEVGGIDYLNLWRDKTPLPQPKITTHEGWIAEQRRRRGGFDETCAAFLDTVLWIGKSAGANGAAQAAANAVGALVSAFTETADLAAVDCAAEEAERALAAFCVALAARLDAPTVATGADGCGDNSVTLGEIHAGVSFLVNDRKDKQSANRKRGMENQAKGDNDATERAARDKATAIARVHGRISHGETNVMQVCRAVCKQFTPLTPRKTDAGKFAAYAPLMGANGDPIKPETLAKAYRERHGTKRQRKANEDANKAQTAAARDAKARRGK